MAQSTDRNNPAPWPSEGVSAFWDGGLVPPHYYVLEAGPGELEILIHAIARLGDSGLAVDLFDIGSRDSDPALAGVALPPGVDGGPTRTQRLTLHQRRRFLLRVTHEGTGGHYLVRLSESPSHPSGTSGGTGGGPAVGAHVEGVVPLQGSMINADGAGVARVHRYSFDGWPGVLRVNGEATAARGSTRLRVNIVDAAGSNLGGVDVTAPSDSLRTGTAAVTISRRQALMMEVYVDANLGP